MTLFKLNYFDRLLANFALFLVIVRIVDSIFDTIYLKKKSLEPHIVLKLQ